MGNCCPPKANEEQNIENKKEIRGGIPVLTFGGPDNIIEAYRYENPPTFADTDIFTEEKKSLLANSVGSDCRKVD